MNNPLTTGIDPMVQHKEVKQPQPTRAQRRQIEHVNQEAGRIHNVLASKFLDYMVECDDPDSDETKAYIRQLHAQWMIFCKRYNLKSEVHNVINEYCKRVLNEYKQDKDNVSD